MLPRLKCSLDLFLFFPLSLLMVHRRNDSAPCCAFSPPTFSSSYLRLFHHIVFSNFFLVLLSKISASYPAKRLGILRSYTPSLITFLYKFLWFNIQLLDSLMFFFGKNWHLLPCHVTTNDGFVVVFCTLQRHRILILKLYWEAVTSFTCMKSSQE